MSQKNDLSISKDMESKIKNYENEFVTIEDPVLAVRKNPDVYIGTLGNTGFLTMVREVFQNSLDEILKGNSLNNTINVWFDERTKTTCVEDFSRGIPFNKIMTAFGKLNSSSNYNKKEGQFSAGKNGMGGSLVNMLSSKFIVESYIFGEGRMAEFSDGHSHTPEPIAIKAPDKKQGARVTFMPSPQVLGDITVSWMDVNDLLYMIAPTVKGITVVYVGTDLDGIDHTNTIKSDEGIASLLAPMTAAPIIKPIYLSNESGRMKAEVILTYDSSFTFPTEQVISFSNTCPTIGGSHVDGFLDGLSKFFREYMNKIYLANSKKKITVVGNDIKFGLKVVISAFHIEAKYTGQNKEILKAPDIVPFMATLAYKGMEEWSKANSQDFQKLCRYFKDVADLRLKSDESKVKLSTNYQPSLLNGGMPAKYVKPTGTKNLELIIVEGDSALGALRNSRNKATQGIFPIRGKLPNAFIKSKSEMLKNEEVGAIIRLITNKKDYDKNYDPSTCRWSKIILGADADPDGSHIRSLLLRFFLLYMPQIITAGLLYSAIPPLYGLKSGSKRGKGGTRYFTQRLDFVKYLQNSFSKNNNICYINGKPISNMDLMGILYRNFDYPYEMTAIATTFAVNPYLLEFLLAIRNYPFKEFKRLVKEAYRFLEVSNENGTIVITGLCEDKVHTVFMNEKMLNACANVISYIDASEKNYIINGQVVNLYGLMKAFDDYMPSSVTRYKGLGEMNPEQLAESTFDIDNRALMRFTIEDVNAEIEAIRYFECNRNDLLKDLVVTKQDLL